MTLKITKIAAVAIVCLAIGMSYSLLHAQQAPATTRSVWDGVYTKAQADRGSSLYGQDCAKCHGPTLSGNGDEAPALVGDNFLSDWTGLTASDLFDRIHNTMPGDAPGSLSQEVDADILAFIFSSNSFPAGTTELAHQSEVLGQIRIESTKPDTK